MHHTQTPRPPPPRPQQQQPDGARKSRYRGATRDPAGRPPSRIPLHRHRRHSPAARVRAPVCTRAQRPASHFCNLFDRLCHIVVVMTFTRASHVLIHFVADDPRLRSAAPATWVPRASRPWPLRPRFPCPCPRSARQVHRGSAGALAAPGLLTRKARPAAPGRTETAVRGTSAEPPLHTRSGRRSWRRASPPSAGRSGTASAPRRGPAGEPLNRHGRYTPLIRQGISIGVTAALLGTLMVALVPGVGLGRHRDRHEDGRHPQGTCEADTYVGTASIAITESFADRVVRHGLHHGLRDPRP